MATGLVASTRRRTVTVVQRFFFRAMNFPPPAAGSEPQTQGEAQATREEALLLPHEVRIDKSREKRWGDLWWCCGLLIGPDWGGMLLTWILTVPLVSRGQN